MARKSTSTSEPLGPESLTDLNLWTLADVVKQHGDADGVFQKMDAPSVPHIRRCLRAGAIESAGKAGYWRVSAVGKALLAKHKLSGLGRRS